ncbi:MAG: phosphatidylserine decarboxylase family protein [Verrucomicrobia bacterium]|jgi:phosphatidylserine decarboxylase|nr:MAG: phosphatidylserine decarboxylase family protein [Verrucomicrobiota bacterium]
MKHAGKAQAAALKIIFFSLGAVLLLLLVGFLASKFGGFILGLSGLLAVLWLLFAIFTFNFFRDPDATVPPGKKLVLAPAHGTVDLIDETEELEFMGGKCRRISIFLNVFDVHVQKAPLSGKMVFHKHRDGQYLSATRSDCAEFNENVLIGFIPAEAPEQKLGVRLIAGLIARRINVWAAAGETVAAGERISLVQFGSRGNVYLPMSATIKVKLGDKMVGGESILATLN